MAREPTKAELYNRCHQMGNLVVAASALLRKPEPSCSRSSPCGLRATDEGQSRRRGDGNEGKVPAFGLAWWQGKQKFGEGVDRKR